jgi:hypothetical protein
MSEIIITKEYLSALGSCYLDENLITATPTGKLLTDNDLWGKPESEVVAFLTEHGYLSDLVWYEDKKKTEAFVRYTGKVITMGLSYQVFNPLTGLHTEYQSEEAAKTAVVEFSRQILESHKPTVCESLSNENGDSVWIPVDFMSQIKVGF